MGPDGPNMAHFKSDVISVKNFKKFKNEFRVKFGARVKIKLQIVFKTINKLSPARIGSNKLCLIEYLTKLSSDSSLIRVVQQAQLSKN